MYISIRKISRIITSLTISSNIEDKKCKVDLGTFLFYICRKV